MATFKKQMKKFGRYVWEFFKSSLPAMIMFFCAGTVLMMLTMKTEEGIDGETLKLGWDNTKLLWTLVCGLAACAYDGLIMWAMGGNAYEMLVSGNIKRISADELGGGYKISAHKEVKEYRPWKGFVIGAFISIFTIATGIIFGCNQAQIDGDLSGGALSIIVLICWLVSGWSILPFYYLNMSGIHVSYFLSCLFALLPIVVSGVFYITGAYSRRRKAIRQQEFADKAAAAEANKVKKINYGGLPGTKPKKKRK